MHIYSIYRATNKINGKHYIGFAKNFRKRMIEHKCAAINDKNNYKFYNAIRKYGWDAFEWEIICQSKEAKYLLNEMEKYFIKEYDSFNNGYNMTYGGEQVMLNKKHSFKTKQKMIDAWNKRKLRGDIPNIGIKRSDETKEKLRQLRLGKKSSIQLKEKLSIIAKNRYNDPKQREITKQKTKEIWEKRRLGLIPYPNYRKKD